MKSCDEFGVENCIMVLIEECPRQNRKQLEKRDGEYIENEKSRLNRCIVGRTKKKNCDATREHHLEETKGRQIIQIDNIEKYKEKDKPHHENNKQNTRKKKYGEQQINMMTRIKGMEEGNREAMRQT